MPLLVQLLGTLERPFVILGNHDVAVTRDPFSRAAELEGLAEVAVLLQDEAAVVEHDGLRIQLVGTDAKSYPKGASRPWELADRDADLRILLCHFPGIARKLPGGAFDLVLAGHLHAGQIVLPYPGGRLLLAHPRSRVVAGTYETRRRRHARVAGHGDDVRPDPLLRPAGGDRARAPRLMRRCAAAV